MASTENFAPNVLKRLAKEMQELASTPPEGIKVLINDEDITDIQAIISGPAGTPYAGGQFRVKLTLSDEFPNAPPKGRIQRARRRSCMVEKLLVSHGQRCIGHFLTKIFHPNVAKNGEICVNTLKRDWKKEYGVQHILLTIKCLLIVPNPESALNEEAGKLLLERYEDYAKHAQLMTSIHAGKAMDAAGGSANEGGATEESAENDADGLADAALKKRAIEKKDDKKVADKKRGLKRL